MLQAALTLQFGDLELHGPQRLLHRRERLQHLALGPLALLARLALEAVPFVSSGPLGVMAAHQLGALRVVTIYELGELSFLVAHPLAEGRFGRLDRREPSGQFRPHPGLVGSHRADLDGVPRLEHRGVLAGRLRRPGAPLDDEPRPERAERDADEEGDEKEELIHVVSVSAGTDIVVDGSR